MGKRELGRMQKKIKALQSLKNKVQMSKINKSRISNMNFSFRNVKRNNED